MRTSSISLCAALATLGALGAAPAMAQVHRCTDADGKVSFSDTVCTGQHAQKTFGNHASSRDWAVVSAPRPPKVAAAAQVAPVAAPPEKPAAVASR